MQNGFERLDTRQLVQLPETGQFAGNVFSQDLTVPLPEDDDALVLPDSDAVDALPAALKKRIELSPESGTLTVRGGITPQEIRRVASTFRLPEAAKKVQEGLDALLAARVARKVVQA